MWLNNVKIEWKNPQPFDNYVNNSCSSKQVLSVITGKGTTSTLHATNLETIQFH